MLKAKSFHVATGHLLCVLGDEPEAKDMFDNVFAPGFKEKKPGGAETDAFVKPADAGTTDSNTVGDTPDGNKLTMAVSSKLPAIGAIEEEEEEELSRSRNRKPTSGAAPAPLPKVARPASLETSASQKKGSTPIKSKPAPPTKPKEKSMFNIGSLLGIDDTPEEIKPIKKYFLSIQAHGK